MTNFSKHIPCGHWHKGAQPAPSVVPDYDIYTLMAAGDGIWGVSFDVSASTLSILGYYDSPSLDVNGLIFYDSNLLTVAGAGATAELRKISPDPVAGVFPLVSTHTPFNQYDAPAPQNSNRQCLVCVGETGTIYYVDAGGIIVQMSDPDTRVARGVAATVTVGTDSNNYYCSYISPAFCWDAGFRPITGGSYSGAWYPFSDGLYDGPTTAWPGGGGSPYSAWGLCDIALDASNLYTANYASPWAPGYVISRATLGITAGVDVGLGAWMVELYEGKLYVGAGVFGTCTFRAYNLGYSMLQEVVLTGRLPRAAGIGEFVAVATVDYVGSGSWLYKLDKDSLTTLGSVTLPHGVETVVALNDQYLAVTWSGGISVYDITDLSEVDSLTMPAMPSLSSGKVSVRRIVLP